MKHAKQKLEFMPFIRAILGIFLVLTLAVSGFAEDKKDDRKGPPLMDAHKKFLDEVYWIISDYEKDAFVSLKTDDDRERFIKAFWENRDPTPGTEKNEFRDEHYTRFAYATKMFGRTTAMPGWKTDRGKVYILMGKPEFIKRNQNPFEFHPMELWQYAGYRGYGLPGSLYMLFYQEKGIGDYRLYSPIHDGIKALFTPVSANVMKTDEELFDYLKEQVDPEVAHAAFSSIPTEGGHPRDATVGQVTAEMIQAKIQNARNYDIAKRKYVEDFIYDRPSVQVYTSIDTGGIKDGIYWFQAPNGYFYVDMVVEFEPDKLDMGQYDNYYTSITIDGAMSTPDKVQVEQILSSHEINLTPAQFDKVKTLPFQFQGRRPLFPGKYEVTLVMNNNVSRRSMTFTHDMEIPNPGIIKSPVISPMILLRSSEKVAPEDRKLRPFQYGDYVSVPNVTGIYQQQGSLPLYHQVLFPAKFQEAGALSLHYFILGGGKIEAETVEALSHAAADLAGNSVDVRKDLPLQAVTLGTKQLVAELRAGDKVIARTEPVAVTIDSKAAPSIWKFAVSIPNYESSYHSFAIAQQLMKLKKMSQALAVLEQALREHPESMEIRVQLMRAALRSEQFQKVIDLGAPMEVKSPRDKELLWLLGWANYGLGKYDEAVRFFERYRIEDPKKVEVLNLLADIYFRLDQKDKSLERVQQSLALKPDQKDIMELKQKLESPQ